MNLNMKEEYLNNIDEFYIKICDLTSSDNPSTLEYFVKQILDLILKLQNEDENCEYEETYRQLNHTLKKEVGYAKSAYEKTLKRNAAKVRMTEYDKQLENAIKQIQIDIWILLQKNKLQN